MNDKSPLVSRRFLMASGSIAAVGLLGGSTKSLFAPEGGPSAFLAQISSAPPVADEPGRSSSLDPRLLKQALAALDRHDKAIHQRDRIAIVDFSASSSKPRFHFLDVASGETSRLLVAHGQGSDPGHTGFLHSFSNAFGSNASSEGAFVTGDYYVGKHGRSQRLVGLDGTNDNALGRAIVMHGAWYANADMLRTHGKLGRSQGCFAVGDNDLDKVFGHLGKGRLLYAAKA